jgi:hypothetical protein
MVSLVQRGVQHPLTAFALALGIWMTSSSTAMAQYGGVGGVGGGGGMGQSGGFGLQGFGGVGGYGLNPGFNGLGNGGNGSPVNYGGSGYPFYGDGTSYGYGLGYGYPTTFHNTGFLAPALRSRKIRRK